VVVLVVIGISGSGAGLLKAAAIYLKYSK
jgi:hypothetical protein